MNVMAKTPPVAQPSPTPVSRREERTLNARALLDGEDTVRIVLDDQTYILRLTRAGKLILTK